MGSSVWAAEVLTVISLAPRILVETNESFAGIFLDIRAVLRFCLSGTALAAGIGRTEGWRPIRSTRESPMRWRRRFGDDFRFDEPEPTAPKLVSGTALVAGIGRTEG